jgi:hypothetical protein
MQVPVGLLYALVPVFVTAGIGFTAWVVRQLGKHAELLAAATSETSSAERLVASELRSHDDRLKRLEGWQDGVQFGRAVESAIQKGEK